MEANTQDNRLQILFDSKPDADIRTELKRNGFRWAPSAGAWQRQLTDNAIYAANRIERIQPLTGEKPTELQKQVRREAESNLSPEPPATGSLSDRLKEKQQEATQQPRQPDDAAHQKKAPKQERE